MDKLTGLTSEEFFAILERIEHKVDKGLENVYLKGISRTTDKLGRLTIPKEFRELLGIQEDTELEICLADNILVIRKKSVDIQE